MRLCRVFALAVTSFVVHGLNSTELPTDGNFDCDAEFWRLHVKHLDSFHLDTSTELSYSRMLGSWITELIERKELKSAAQQCPLGVATLTLTALPAVDFDSGPARARALFDVVKNSLRNVNMTHDFSANYCSHDECNGKNMTRPWNTRMIQRQMDIVELHYDPKGRFDCNGAKFYVYETPLTRTPQSHVAKEEYWIGLNYSPLNCRFGMYGTEVLFHEFAKGCRTKDPDEANFFFVPSYFKCLSALNYVDRYDNEDLERPSVVLFNQTLAHVESLPYFARNDGIDHIWLFSWGRYPCILPYRNRLRHARFLQVENRCEDVNKDE